MKKGSEDKIGLDEIKRGKVFGEKLLRWNRYENNRQMPWKGEKDPYKIWLSEIILQQTRVEQGLKYYQNFIATFPNVQTLATAPEDKVFKLWEGLGYYSRCRNLIQTAKYVAEKLEGVFPNDYEAILSLKGVGYYTASAIASFAYNLHYAVLDGNVFRVLSRIFDKEIPIDSTKGKREFTALAQQILPKNKAGEYNQAIMDFGAVVCKPVPICDECFFNKHCLAFLTGKQQLLPVKEKTIKIKKRWLNYFIVQCGDEVLIQQRSGKDIWQGLHQFILIETDQDCKQGQLKSLLQKQHGIETYTISYQWEERQVLSHQIICFHFFQIKLKKKKNVDGYIWVKVSHLQEIAFPKTLQQAIQTHLL
jgi:A/G-specific adenine glycosylase